MLSIKVNSMQFITCKLKMVFGYPLLLLLLVCVAANAKVGHTWAYRRIFTVVWVYLINCLVYQVGFSVGKLRYQYQVLGCVLSLSPPLCLTFLYIVCLNKQVVVFSVGCYCWPATMQKLFVQTHTHAQTIFLITIIKFEDDGWRLEGEGEETWQVRKRQIEKKTKKILNKYRNTDSNRSRL